VPVLERPDAGARLNWIVIVVSRRVQPLAHAHVDGVSAQRQLSTTASPAT